MKSVSQNIFENPKSDPFIVV